MSRTKIKEYLCGDREIAINAAYEKNQSIWFDLQGGEVEQVNDGTESFASTLEM